MDNEQLVQAYQETKDNKYLEELIENNKKMIHKIVNKFLVDNEEDKEDLFQEGCIGLMSAAKKYDINHDRKAKFITYATYSVYQCISRYVNQKYIKHKEVKSLNLDVSRDEENSTELIDTIQDDNDDMLCVEDTVFFNQMHSDLEELMKEKLSLKHIAVIKMLFGWGCKEFTSKEVKEIMEYKHYADVDRVREGGLNILRRTPYIVKLKTNLTDLGYIRSCDIDYEKLMKPAF